MQKLNTPDLTAPRFRPTRLSLMNKEFFKKFYDKYPQYIDIDEDTLKKIISSFNKKIWQEVIENRDGVELPKNLGFLFVGTCLPPKKHNTDYDTSVKYEKKIMHKNFESDGYVAKIFYTNYASKYKFKSRELWQFKGHRDFTRAVSKAYPENWKKYVQVENFQLINKLFKKSKTKLYFAEKTENALPDYNEFDMD